MNKFANDKKLLDGASLIASMSLSQLQEFQTMLSTEVKKRHEETKREAMTQIRNIAAVAGIALEDIIKSTPKTARVSASPVAIKYRHPEKPELVWTGRGRHPQWVKDWNEQNGNTDALLVS